jgi:single-strand DNA-binding protein
VVVWGVSAENCAKYLMTGSAVFVEGRLQTRKWQEQDGKNRYRTEVIASRVEFLGGRKGDTAIPAQDGAPLDEAELALGMSDDLTGALVPPVSFADDEIPF